MNNSDIEKDLLNNGFSQRDILAMRKHLGEKGVTYLTLLAELRVRFGAAMLLVFILVIVWAYYLIYGEQIEAISFSITLFIAAPLFYIFTPARLGFKAFMYRRESQLPL